MHKMFLALFPLKLLNVYSEVGAAAAEVCRAECKWVQVRSFNSYRCSATGYVYLSVVIS